MFSCGNCFQRYVCKMVVKKQTRQEIIKEGLKEWSYETALHGLKYMKPGRTGILGIMIWVKKLIKYFLRFTDIILKAFLRQSFFSEALSMH